MPNVKITSLPDAALPLQPTDLVELIQGPLSTKAMIGSIAPSTAASYIVVGLDGVLANERQLAVTTRMVLTDNGPNATIVADINQASPFAWTGQNQWFLPLLGPDGAVGTPSFAFASDPDTGMWRGAANQLAWSVAGITAMVLDATQLFLGAALQVRPGDGAAATPVYSFDLDRDTGIYRPGTDVLRLVGGGTIALELAPSGAVFNRFFQPLGVADGSTGAPGLTFDSDRDTGLFRVGANTGALSGGGVRSLIWNDTGQLFSSIDGTAAAPAWTFNSDGDTGLYRVGVNNLGFSTGGAVRLGLADTSFTSLVQIINADGTLGAPGYSFFNDPNTGLYRIASDRIGFSVGGIAVAETGTFGGSAYFQVNNTMTLFVPTGAVATPGVAFGADIDTGFWLAGANTLAASTGGAQRLTVDANGLNITAGNFLLGTDGSVAIPGYTFGLDTDTGIYRVSANTIRIANGGVPSIQFSTAAISPFLAVQGVSGSAGSPGYSFDADPDTGMYRVGANVLGFAAGGTVSFEIGAGSALLVDGDASTPGLAFIGDGNTGLYRVSADIVAMSVGGAQIMNWDNSSPFRVVAKARIEGADGSPSNPGFTFEADPNTGIYRSAADNVGISLGGVLQYEFDDFNLIQTGVGAASGFVTSLGFSSGFRAVLTSNNHMRIETTRANGNMEVNAPAGGQIALQIAGSTILGLANAPTTGAQTATFMATNKPGVGTAGPTNWLPVQVGGLTYYIPMFGA